MAVSFHMAERTLKSGSLKKFIKEVEESNISIFDYNYSMFRQAVSSGHFHIVKYLFLGDLHTLYKPALLDSLIAHVRLSGRDVFNIPNLCPQIPFSDNPEIFEFIKAFNYPVLSEDIMDSILRNGNYNLLTHLLSSGQLTQEIFSKITLERIPFEALVLINSKFKVSLKPNSYLAKHEDSRIRIFQHTQLSNPYSVSSFIQALHDENFSAAREMLNHIEIERGSHDRILQLVLHLNGGADILPDLLSRNIRPSNLKTLLDEFVDQYEAERCGTLFTLMENLATDVGPILLKDQELTDKFLRKDVLWIDLLVRKQMINTSYENMVKILSCREPNSIGRYYISLFTYGFPVRELILDDFSSGQLKALKRLKKYFSENNMLLLDDEAHPVSLLG